MKPDLLLLNPDFPFLLRRCCQEGRGTFSSAFMFLLELTAYKVLDKPEQVSRPWGPQDPLRHCDNTSKVHTCQAESVFLTSRKMSFLSYKVAPVPVKRFIRKDQHSTHGFLSLELRRKCEFQRTQMSSALIYCWVFGVQPLLKQTSVIYSSSRCEKWVSEAKLRVSLCSGSKSGRGGLSFYRRPWQDYSGYWSQWYR